MILEVQPFETENDYQQMIDYFRGADDLSLRAMGVDRSKILPRERWLERLLPDLKRPEPQKHTYYLSWRFEGVPIGHSNVNQIVYGAQAFVHLHLWDAARRRNGWGSSLFQRSLQVFISQLRLRRVICEPYAANPAPSRVLATAGFQLIRRYRTTPGIMNFEQDVDRWELEVTPD